MPARLALAALALLAGCAPAPGASSPSDGAPPVSLTVADAGRRIPLGVGERVVVSLASNPTTGYSWALADSADGALARDGASVYRPDASAGATPMPGRGGTETWTFRGARDGEGTLRLVYRRPFDPEGTAPAETFSVSVVVLAPVIMR